MRVGSALTRAGRRGKHDAPKDSARATISAAVSGVAPSMGDLDDLLRAADEALYSAKQTGRSRIVSDVWQASSEQV